MHLRPTQKWHRINHAKGLQCFLDRQTKQDQVQPPTQDTTINSQTHPQKTNTAEQYSGTPDKNHWCSASILLPQLPFPPEPFPSNDLETAMLIITHKVSKFNTKSVWILKTKSITLRWCCCFPLFFSPLWERQERIDIFLRLHRSLHSPAPL